MSPQNLRVPWWATEIWEAESSVCASCFLGTPDYIAGMDCGALVPVSSPLVRTKFVFFARSAYGDEMNEHIKAIEQYA